LTTQSGIVILFAILLKVNRQKNKWITLKNCLCFAKTLVGN
jgi:hypothetical protein